MNILQTESLEFADSFSYNDDAIIDSPGKFEGEPQYTPFYWNLMMNGANDEVTIVDNDDVYWIFHLNDEDKDIFPELENVRTLSISVSNLGFVFSDLDLNFDSLR